MEVRTVQSHRHSSLCRGMDGTVHFSMSSASRFSPIASDRRAFTRILFVALPFIHSSSILVNLSRVVGWSRVITFSVAVVIPSCNPSWCHTAATVHSWFSRSGMCPCTSKPGRRERQITGFTQFFKCYFWLTSCNICSHTKIANLNKGLTVHVNRYILTHVNRLWLQHIGHIGPKCSRIAFFAPI